eukprot:TRINITY_DN3674_c0_g1_i2.p1 TRINITY_DN3674_c0_g1~~TRINITY_DN3674_c0_g1_i2.p1  ORF type:complete len:888 (+),score=130.01 TRINITY_DN3674_c0_g1_i2:66-2729(+)
MASPPSWCTHACFLAILHLQCIPFLTTAHTTTVCSATAPSQCADRKLVFLLGTYHSMSGSTVGKVHILSPSGVETQTSFSAICQSSSTATGTCPGPDIKNKCPSSVIPSDAVVTCYKETNGVGYSVADTCDAFPVTSGSYAKNLANAYAVVSGATSGTYTLWTTGTNADFNPCTYVGWPCRLSATRKYEFELMVAGCGDDCPTAPSINGSLASSVSGCSNAFDGYVCPVQCKPGWVKSGGALVCNNGTWEGQGGAQVSCGPPTTTTSTSTTSYTSTSSTSTSYTSTTTGTATSTTTLTLTTTTISNTSTTTTSITATRTTQTITLTTTTKTVTLTSTTTITTTTTATITATSTTKTVTTTTVTTATVTTATSTTSTITSTATSVTGTSTTTTVTNTLPTVFVSGRSVVGFSAPTNDCSPFVPAFEKSFSKGLYAQLAKDGFSPEDVTLKLIGTCKKKGRRRLAHTLHDELEEESDRGQVLDRRMQASQVEFEMSFDYSLAMLKKDTPVSSLNPELKKDVKKTSGSIDAAAMALALVKRFNASSIMQEIKTDFAKSKDPQLALISVSSVKINTAPPVVVGQPSMGDTSDSDDDMSIGVIIVIILALLLGVCCIGGFLYWMFVRPRHSEFGKKYDNSQQENKVHEAEPVTPQKEEVKEAEVSKEAAPSDIRLDVQEPSIQPVTARVACEAYPLGSEVEYYSLTEGAWTYAHIASQGHFDTEDGLPQFPKYQITLASSSEQSASGHMAELWQLRPLLVPGQRVHVDDANYSGSGLLVERSVEKSAAVVYKIAVEGKGTYESVPGSHVRRSFEADDGNVEIYQGAKMGWIRARVEEKAVEVLGQQNHEVKEGLKERHLELQVRVTFSLETIASFETTVPIHLIRLAEALEL